MHYTHMCIIIEMLQYKQQNTAPTRSSFCLDRRTSLAFISSICCMVPGVLKADLSSYTTSLVVTGEQALRPGKTSRKTWHQ